MVTLAMTVVFKQRESERQRRALANLKCCYYRAFGWVGVVVFFWGWGGGLVFSSCSRLWV